MTLLMPLLERIAERSTPVFDAVLIEIDEKPKTQAEIHRGVCALLGRKVERSATRRALDRAVALGCALQGPNGWREPEDALSERAFTTRYLEAAR